MFSASLLALREGLEAALIIGILLGALNKMKLPHLKQVVWWGTGSAAVLSLLVALGLQAVGVGLEGEAEEIFEGGIMLVAAGVLTWMIFWMHQQARHIKGQLEVEVRRAVTQPGRFPLFLLAFVAVVREGIELALFMTANVFAAGGVQTLAGSIVGLGAAAILGWMIFSMALRLDLRRFFQVTGLLLLLFAAGLVAHGVHELNEVGWVPAVVEHVWDVNPLLDEKSPIGVLLATLFGYNGNPSLTEVLAYAVYMGVLLYKIGRPLPRQQQVVQA